VGNLRSLLLKVRLALGQEKKRGQGNKGESKKVGYRSLKEGTWSELLLHRGEKSRDRKLRKGNGHRRKLLRKGRGEPIYEGEYEIRA